jgi:hypothetical protein
LSWAGFCSLLNNALPSILALSNVTFPLWAGTKGLAAILAARPVVPAANPPVLRKFRRFMGPQPLFRLVRTLVTSATSPGLADQRCISVVAGVNALAMAALRASPHLLEEFGLTSGAEEARPKLTLKELAKTRKRVN